MKLRRPSPAMIVACIALFVALSGAGYAAFSLPDNSVKSRHIVNGQVKSADLATGLLSKGRWNAALCDPGVSDATCATINMSLPRRARVLLIVSGSWHEQGTPQASTLGHCFLMKGTTNLWTASYGQKTQTFEQGVLGGSPFSGTVSMTYVTGALSTGTHNFHVDCRENGPGDITYAIQLSAVTVSAG
jgi:hypothetical protein